MPSELRPSPNAAVSAGATGAPEPLGAAEAELLDALVVFLRTVPVYPDGHARVEIAAERLARALDAVRGEHPSIELRVKSGAMYLHRKAVDLKGPGRRDLRAALASTAVARLAFEPDVPRASLVTLARTLHDNVKRARASGSTFADLWPEEIPGVRIGEQRFSEAAFLDGPGDGAGSPGATGSGGSGDGLGFGLRKAAESSTADRWTDDLGVSSVASEVRRRVESSTEVRAFLEHLEQRLLAKIGEEDVPSRGDFLENVLRLLPAEARNDSELGLRAVERILERFSSAIETALAVGEDERAHARVLRVLARFFPSRGAQERRASALKERRAREEKEEFPEGGVDEPQSPEKLAKTPISPEDFRRDAERSMSEDLDLLRREVALGADIPTISADGEVGESLGVILVNTVLSAPDAGRRETMRLRLVERLKDGKAREEAESLAASLREEVGRPAEARDGERLRLLAAIFEDARLEDLASSCGALEAPVVAAVFPRLFRAYVLLRRGVAGRVCRLVGRRAVLSVAGALVAPGGLLSGPGAERVLGERSRDVLPLAEVCLTAGAPALRDAAIRMLRAVDLPCAAAVALRAIEPAALPDAFLSGLCEEGFEGGDSHGLDATAIALLRRQVEAPAGQVQSGLRLYAIASLGAFEHRFVDETLKHLLRRRLLLFPVNPRAVRRAARDALDRRGGAPAGEAVTPRRETAA